MFVSLSKRQFQTGQCMMLTDWIKPIHKPSIQVQVLGGFELNDDVLRNLLVEFKSHYRRMLIFNIEWHKASSFAIQFHKGKASGIWLANVLHWPQKFWMKAMRFRRLSLR